MRRAVFYFFVFLLSSPCFAAYLPPATGKSSMVVTPQHLATNVGVAILKNGGNAVDAAVAIGYALAVVHPCCGNIGGGGFMLLHRSNGENIFLDFREVAPSSISSKLYLSHNGTVNPKKSRYGYLAVGIPGTVLGLNTALKRYGTMSLKQVMRPAIRLAEKGFILQAGDIKILNKGVKFFKKQKSTTKTFLNQGKPYQASERLKQPELAKTLKAISKKGSDVFYRGWIANAIVKDSQAHGGVLTLKDFENYRVQTRNTISCQYRGYTVITTSPPSSGVILCEMLNILGTYPLGQLGYHSASSTNYNLEAMRYAFADRNRYLGDPDFVLNPAHALLSKEHAANIRKRIIPNKAGNSSQLNAPKISTQMNGNTTNYEVVDQQGNAVSLTYTLNSLFGSKMMASNTGFFLNNELDDFTIKLNAKNKFKLQQGKNNLIEPNKRPLSSMSPTMIFTNKKLFMSLGAAGGPTIITTILQTIEHVIDDQMNINAALNSPRYHMQWIPDITYMEPYCFSTDTLRILKGMGYRFKEGSSWGSRYWGHGAAILIDPKTNQIYGANDNRYPAGLAKGF